MNPYIIRTNASKFFLAFKKVTVNPFLDNVQFSRLNVKRNRPVIKKRNLLASLRKNDYIACIRFGPIRSYYFN